MVNRRLTYLTPENMIELVVFIFAILYVTGLGTDVGFGKARYYINQYADVSRYV